MRRETQQKPRRKGMIDMKGIVNIARKMENKIAQKANKGLVPL
jgi:hypothetical protein